MLINIHDSDPASDSASSFAILDVSEALNPKP